MDDMGKGKTPTKAEAKRSMEALQKLKFLLKQDRISYDAAREFAEPHLKTWNAYSQSAARKMGGRISTLSFGSFVR